MAAEHSSRTERTLDAIKRQPVVLISGALMSVIAALLVVLGIPASVQSAIEVIRPAAEPVHFEDDELAEQRADQFTFKHPKVWARGDSLSRDGYTFTDPDDHDFLIRGYQTSLGGSRSVESWAAETAVDLETAGADIQFSVYDGATLNYLRDGRNWSQDAPGWRIQYTIADTEGHRSVTVVKRIVQATDHLVVVESQAPADEWDRWGPEFLRLMSLARFGR